MRPEIWVCPGILPTRDRRCEQHACAWCSRPRSLHARIGVDISDTLFLSLGRICLPLSCLPLATPSATPSRPATLVRCETARVSMLALGFSFWRHRLLLIASCSRSSTRRFVQGVLHVPAATPEGPETD